jgi:phosphoadenosine phosphosulfate reductase
MITYQSSDIEKNFLTDNETKGALDVLEWAYSSYESEDIIYACSFGIEGIVLIDLISRVKQDASIFFLDTNVHFQETYDVIEKVKKRYPTLSIKLVEPKLSLQEQEKQYGKELWKSDPNQCCHLRKVVPLQDILSTKEAWISGLRREQSPTRQNTNFVNRDHKFKNIKICPLIHWTWKDIWRYAHRKDLDYNVLHDKGYPSIGCSHCTVPAIKEDDFRSGRWQGQSKLECGLHEDVSGR